MILIDKILSRGNGKKTAASLLIPLLIIMSKPMGMTYHQSAIFGMLILTLLWWGTGWVHQNAASGLLIIFFLIKGGTPITEVLTFPLSETFVLVIMSYLLTRGIQKSGLTEAVAYYLLERYCHCSKTLVIMSFALCSILIFVIPQPFPRVLMLASIYTSYFGNHSCKIEEQKVIMLSIFVAGTVTALLFLNADVIANYAAIGFGGLNITGLDWIRYMTVPTLGSICLVLGAFFLAFWRDLTSKFFESERQAKFQLTKNGLKSGSIMALVVFLWFTEPSHGVNAAAVATFGVAGMLALRVLNIKDYKAVNFNLLLFMTAQFAVGKVLIENEIAGIIKNYLLVLSPGGESLFYFPFIILIIMIMHMFLGSIITLQSIAIPMLIIFSDGFLSAGVIVFLTCACSYFHYFLPFHQVTVMVGHSENYYDSRILAGFGCYLTAVTIIAALCFYLPWWKLTGLI